MGSPAYPMTVSRMAQEIAEQTGQQPKTDWLWKRQFDELDKMKRQAEVEQRLYLWGMVLGCAGLVVLLVMLCMEGIG